MQIINGTTKNFEQEVLQAEGTVLVDIWAPWCGPCKMLSPILEEVAQELDQLKIVKVNADEAMEIAQKYMVTSIPALLVIKDGQEINRSIGLKTKEEIIKLIEG